MLGLCCFYVIATKPEAKALNMPNYNQYNQSLNITKFYCLLHFSLRVTVSLICHLEILTHFVEELSSAAGVKGAFKLRASAAAPPSFFEMLSWVRHSKVST